MYGGKIQEVAPVGELFHAPLHPYTQGLLASLPRVDGMKADRLTMIPGSVPESSRAIPARSSGRPAAMSTRSRGALAGGSA